jgi:hypothetical protein
LGPKDGLFRKTEEQREDHLADVDELEFDLSEELGATGGNSVQRLTLYVPTRDQGGNAIPDVSHWISEAKRILAAIGGGYTALPPFDGGWINEQGALIEEEVFLLYTYIRPKQFLADLPKLRDFLHSLGRETGQGEVAIEFDEVFYRITEFDPEEPS